MPGFDSFGKKGIKQIILFVVALQIASGLLIYTFLNNWSERGQFGDMFGFTNSLFSGLAFAGVVYAIYLQREDLRIQNKEVEENKKRYQEQIDNLLLQSFENTFFQLIRQHKDILESIYVANRQGERIYGREAFYYTVDKFKQLESTYSDVSDDDIKDRINNLYFNYCLSEHAEFGHYFRNMYHIIKFINESNINDKKRYTSLVRAQLSGNEHILLFYNCIAKVGKEKFKPLVEKYALLENIPKTDLIKRFKRFYDDSAYGEDAKYF